MHIKSIVAGAAIALAATIGSASAADQFATLAGITAEPIPEAELAKVIGSGVLASPGPNDLCATIADRSVGGTELTAVISSATPVFNCEVGC